MMRVMHFRTLAFGMSVLTLTVARAAWAEERKPPIDPGAQHLDFTKPPALQPDDFQSQGDFKPYLTCLEREARAAVRKLAENGTKALYIENEKVAGQVFALCTSRSRLVLTPFQRWLYGGSTVVHVKEARNILMGEELERRRTEERAQVKRDLPMLPEEEPAANMWRECLLRNARAIALLSMESAEIVREAVFAACRREREAIRYHGRTSEEMMDSVEKRLARWVLLEIIKARVVPPSPSKRPAEVPHRDQI
jgi:hypothetical protein